MYMYVSVSRGVSKCHLYCFGLEGQYYRHSRVGSIRSFSRLYLSVAPFALFNNGESSMALIHVWCVCVCVCVNSGHWVLMLDSINFVSCTTCSHHKTEGGPARSHMYCVARRQANKIYACCTTTSGSEDNPCTSCYAPHCAAALCRRKVLLYPMLFAGLKSPCLTKL